MIKKMIMRTINKILLFLLLTGIWSCDSWLDVKPSDQVSENKVFESEKGFLFRFEWNLYRVDKAGIVWGYFEL